jgi:hypothetical protein
MEAVIKRTARTTKLRSLSAGSAFRLADELDVLLKTADVETDDGNEVFNTCRLNDGQLLALHGDTAVVRLRQVADVVFEDHGA